MTRFLINTFLTDKDSIPNIHSSSSAANHCIFNFCQHHQSIPALSTIYTRAESPPRSNSARKLTSVSIKYPLLTMVRTTTTHDDLFEENPRPHKRMRTLPTHEIMLLRKFDTHHPETTPSSPFRSGRKRSRLPTDSTNPSSRKRRAPVAHPSSTPKRSKVQEEDNDIHMCDYIPSPIHPTATPLSASTRKSAHRKKSVKEVLRQSRRTGNSSAHCQSYRHQQSYAHESSCPSTSTAYSYGYESSAQYAPNISRSHGADSSTAIHPLHTHNAESHSTPLRQETCGAHMFVHQQNSSDDICEVDVSSGAFDEKASDNSTANSGAPGAPSLQYLFVSENQLLLNIMYGSSRKVGVVVEIPHVN